MAGFLERISAGGPWALCLVFLPNLGYAQKIEVQSQARITVGKNFDSIEAMGPPNSTPGAISIDSLKQEQAFYALNLGSAVSQKSAVYDWTNAIAFESGRSFQGDSTFSQVNLSSTYTYNRQTDTFKLGLSGAGGQGDLNYRRPPLIQKKNTQTFSEIDSRTYSLVASYGLQLSPYTKLSWEGQSSIYDQDSVRVVVHKLGSRGQHLLTSFWDTGVYITGTQQEIDRSAVVSRSIEAGWTNNFRPSFQDVITQGLGFIKTFSEGSDSINSTYALSYSHLFENNKLFQTESSGLPTGLRKEGDNPSPKGIQQDTLSQEKMLMEKLREANLKNLVSIYWIRSLSALENGNQQFVTDQNGIVYDFSHSQGHDIQASVFQASQLDPSDTTRVQRLDRTARATYTKVLRSIDSNLASGMDRVSLESLYQWTEERNAKLKGIHWIATIAYETRF